MMHTRPLQRWLLLCGLLVGVTLNTWAQPNAADTADTSMAETPQPATPEALALGRKGGARQPAHSAFRAGRCGRDSSMDEHIHGGLRSACAGRRAA